MCKTTMAIAAAAMITIVGVAAPDQAEARGGRIASGIIGGLAAGAIIGSLAARGGYYYGPEHYYGSVYDYGPRYYYGPAPYVYEAPPVYVVPRSGYYGGPRSGSTAYSHGGFYYGPVGGECFPCY